MGHPMRLKLTCVGLPVKFANYYTTQGAQGLNNTYTSVLGPNFAKPSK